MARLFPSKFPIDSDPRRRAEREFFQACGKSLGDDWIVVYSHPYVGVRPSLGRTRKPGEADFVLLHRTHGLLAVEVKGGSIDIRDGSWMSTDAERGTHEIKNPFTQAEEASHILHDSLRRSLGDVRASKTVNYCVAFPAVSRKHLNGFSTYGPNEICIFREDLSSLSGKVQEIVRFWKQSTRWSDDDFTKVKQLLLPSIKTPGVSYLEYVDVLMELDKLTESQKRTIRQITRISGRLIITGGAGTGKTVLGMYRAQQLAADGKRVLFLCANNSLARHLRQELKLNGPEQLSNLTINSASNFISETARAGTRGEEFERRKAMFPERGDRFIDAIESTGQESAFDCLVLDEAQDIRKQDLELLELLVRPFSDGGSVLIFGDPNQQLSLKKVESALNSLSDGPGVVLDVNCRNTYEIARVAHVFTNQPVETLETRQGIQIRNVTCSGNLGACVKVEVDAVRSEFDPRSIVVLTLNGLNDVSEDDSLFVDGARLETGSALLTGDVCDRIPVYSARSFQGREADAVIVAIGSRSLLKTYPFKEFAREVGQSRRLTSRSGTIDDLRRVEGQFERFKQKVVQEKVPEFRRSLRDDEPDLSERRFEFLVEDFERTRLLEFAPDFRDPYLEKAWDGQQQRSLKVALYSMMTRARVILSVVCDPDAKEFIDERLSAVGDEVADLVDEFED